MIELLAASFARIVARRDDAGALFYARLFATAPELHGYFRGSIASQRDKLMSLLAEVVEYYRVGVDPQSYLARLGMSESSYGGRRAQFEAVGDALLFTLAHVLREDFSPGVRAVWATAYAEVSAAMLRIGEPPMPSLYPLEATARV
jgi:hemoglobin-like flavoprotein